MHALWKKRWIINENIQYFQANKEKGARYELNYQRRYFYDTGKRHGEYRERVMSR